MTSSLLVGQAFEAAKQAWSLLAVGVAGFVSGVGILLYGTPHPIDPMFPTLPLGRLWGTIPLAAAVVCLLAAIVKTAEELSLLRHSMVLDAVAQRLREAHFSLRRQRT